MQKSINKKIALYSNSWDTNAGGGIVYILSVAKILLLKKNEVTVYFFDSVNLTELHNRYDTAGLDIRIINRKPFPFLTQLKYALVEWFNYDIVIQQSLVAPRLTFVKKSYVLCDFPMKKTETYSEKMRLWTWKNIIANSEFTKKEILNRWKRSSIVIYPPIEETFELNLYKNKDIVCIGRFNNGKRSKRQDIIIQCFIDLIKSGFIDCKLHFIGYVGDRTYLNNLKKLAEGYPICFYENCTPEKRKAILKQSNLFISACGYDIDEMLEPMFVEHYGIAVVEAMSHGCIPLVTGKGGHKETVDHEINGYHWFTIAELKAKMIVLLTNDELRKEMSSKAFVKSSNYSNKIIADWIVRLFVNKHS